MDKVEKIISAIRHSNPDAIELYTNGQCYAFSLILREIFDEAEIWYDQMEGHVYTRIGKYWYDIRGKHYRVSKHCSPKCHKSGHRPHRWGKGVTIGAIQGRSKDGVQFVGVK